MRVNKKQRRKRTLQLLQKCWGQSCEKCQLSHKPPCPSFPAETCYVSKGQRSLPAYDCQHDAEYTLCAAQHQDVCLRVVFWSPLPTQPVSYFREKHLFSLDSMLIVRSYMGFLSQIPSSTLWSKAFLHAITKLLGFPLVALNLTLEYG